MTHRRDETTDAGRKPRFITALAEDDDTVLAAQRLRYRVFNAGSSNSPSPLVTSERIDRDAFILIVSTWSSATP